MTTMNQIHLWEKNRDAPDLTIPFCSRMTIGLHTQVAMRQDEIRNLN